MRSGTIVAGITVGVLGAAGVGTASAADLPIAISLPQGTVTVGGYAQATASAPASFVGTIDTATLNAAFPKETSILPDATLENVAFGAPYGTGELVIRARTEAFTGAPNVTTGSLDLTGSVTYRLTATTATGTYTCLSTSAVPLTLTGQSLDLATGAYAVQGQQTNVLLRAENVADLLAGAFCTSQVVVVAPGAAVRSAFSGTLTIPNVIPIPKVPATPAPTVPAAPSTPAAPAGPSAPTATGRLRVTVSKPAAVRRGRSTVTTVVVRNVGAGTARGVGVRIAAPGRGVTPRATTKTYASIAPGRTRTIRLRLRTTRSAAKSSRVTATATGTGGLSASRTVSLKLR